MKRILRILPLLVLMCFTLSAFTVTAANTAPEEAITLRIKNIDKGISLSWNGDKSTTYSVYKKTGSGKYIKTASVKGKSYTDREVSSGTEYGYCIRKTKKIKSSHISVTYLNAPKIKKAEIGSKGIFLSWSSVNGAEKYIIYRCTEGEKFKKLGSVTALNYTDKTAEANVKYYYALKAYKDGSYSALSDKRVGMKLTGTDVTSVAKGRDCLAVSWKKVKSADKYVIYRRHTEKEAWKKISTVSSSVLTYNDTSVKSGKSYTYRVNVLVGSEESPFTGAVMSETYIAPPENFTLEQTGTKIRLKWDKLSGVTGFELYRKVADGKWKKHKVLSAADEKFSETLSTCRKKVSYKIRAVAVNGKSAFTKSVTIRYIDPDRPMVALTYDDGPHPVNTHAILDVLEKYGARATFFVVGNRIKTYKDCIEREAELGCEIGNHSFSHLSFSSSEAEKVKEEISKTDKLIKEYSGQTCRLIRAPGGSVGKALELTDKPFIHWSIDTRDWENRSCSKTVAHIKNQVRDGSIILMHDLYGSTAEATKEIVPWLINKGYQLVTVSELMEARGIEPEGGKVYYNFYY